MFCVINRCKCNDFCYFNKNPVFVVFKECLHTALSMKVKQVQLFLQLFCMSDEAKPAATKKLKEDEHIKFSTSDSKSCIKKKSETVLLLYICGIKHDINRFLWFIVIVYGTCRFSRRHTNSSLGDIWELSVTWLTKRTISCQKLSSVCHW